jgi:N utilization substance protein A
MVSEIVLTEDTLRYIALFQQITHTNAVDCMDAGDKLVFVVEKGQGNIAVGKKGDHMIKLSEMTGGKSIQVVEYSEDPQQFVLNVFHIYNPSSVVIEQRGNITHATVTVDPALKGRAIGKNGKNLRIARDIVNRHHDIQSLSVQ